VDFPHGQRQSPCGAEERKRDYAGLCVPNLFRACGPDAPCPRDYLRRSRQRSSVKSRKNGPISSEDGDDRARAAASQMASPRLPSISPFPTGFHLRLVMDITSGVETSTVSPNKARPAGRTRRLPSMDRIARAAWPDASGRERKSYGYLRVRDGEREVQRGVFAI